VTIAAVTHWPPREVTEIRRRLDELEQLVRVPVDEVSQDARDWLARLLVIRSCGYVEQTVIAVGRGYLSGRSSGPAKSFGDSWLDRGPNPSPSALAALTGRFDSSWAVQLGELLDEGDQRLHRDMAVLVDRRNKIAHGLNEGIGTVRALQLKGSACEVADWFIRRFNPARP
jgi:hypothetical protein